MLSSFAIDTVTRIRAPLVADEYGTPNAKRDWANAVESDFIKCNVQFQSTPELTDGRNAVVTRTTLRIPAQYDLVATDRVRWQGNVYEVDGEVSTWTSFSGNLNHKQASLIKVRG